MNLRDIKTEALLTELIERCGDQLGDPEPMYDGILSFLTESELDWLMGECSEAMKRAEERTENERTKARSTKLDS